MNLMKLFIVAILAALLVCPHLYGSESSPRIVPENATNFVQFFVKDITTNRVENNSVLIKGTPTKFGTFSFFVQNRTAANVPYENQLSDIVIVQDKKIVRVFQIKGYKRFETTWVDENVLKFEIWPSSNLELIELVDIRNGKILFTDARRHL